jgi:membrane associated rhomboid family serine protease
MLEIQPAGQAHDPWLDVCRRCHMVWFDPAEFERMPKLPPRPESTESPVVRQAGALMKIQMERERAERQVFVPEAPDEWWKKALTVFGLPVETARHEITTLPIATWGVALAILAVSVSAVVLGLETVIEEYGFRPSDPGRRGGLTLLASFFLHGSLIHLLGNLYFLLVFGDNVEEFLGRTRFILLLALATLAGDLAHALGDPRPDRLAVGASGGISGMLAFYALTFPHIRIGLMWRIWFYFRWFQVSASLAFVMWLAWQFMLAGLQLAGHGQVSALAHLGGVVIGVLFWLMFRARPPRPDLTGSDISRLASGAKHP